MINKHNQHRNHKVNLGHVLRNRNNLIKTTKGQKLREYKNKLKQIDKQINKQTNKKKNFFFFLAALNHHTSLNL